MEFRCLCSPGYQLVDGRCDDIDECLSGTHNCSDSLCQNLPGGFRCECPDGSLDQNGTCKQIDYCELEKPCSQECSIVNSSLICSCWEGYSLSSDLVTCVDINECAQTTSHNCSQRCINTPGNYTCSCDPGFQLDQDGQMWQKFQVTTIK